MSTPHVLLIDDEACVLEPLREFLQKDSYRVTTAQGGRRGLDAFAADPPDLVILDAMMPDVNGFRVLEALRAMDDAVPVLMLTGRACISDATEAEEPPDSFLRKPVGRRQLLQTVRYLLQTSQATSVTASQLLQQATGTA